MEEKEGKHRSLLVNKGQQTEEEGKQTFQTEVSP